MVQHFYLTRISEFQVLLGKLVRRIEQIVGREPAGACSHEAFVDYS